MQQPQSRPLLGDSVSSTTSPTTRRNNNPVAVLTQQQLQQLQQLQSQNSGGQPVTFTLQQSSSNGQDQANGSTTGNHILYLNQLNQLNQSPINSSGTGMGLPQATPTFGVGLNMGLPLSLLNTGLSSLTSNAITTSSPLLNLNIPSINSGLTAINPNLNQLSALGTNLNSNLPSDSISNGLSNLSQDLNNINSGINRLGTLNSNSINSGLSNISSGLTSVNPNLTSLNTSALNQNLATINTNLNASNATLSSNLNLSSNNVNSALNQQGLSRPLNTITNFNSTSSNAQFPFQTIQSIQSIAPHIIGSSISNVSSSISQNQSTNITSTAQTSNSGSSPGVNSTFTSTGPILATTSNTAQGSSNNQQINLAQFGIMNTNMSNVITSQASTNDSNLNSSLNQGFQRQFSNQNLNQSANTSPASNSIISNMKTMQNIQNQTNSSPGSPFSIPMKSPASNIAPPTPSPSPNRLHLRSPASNAMQSRNSPSPVSSNANIIMQSQSPMQSPIGQIQSPVPSPYPPAKSPHPLNSNSNLNNKSPAPGGSPGPPVVRPNTPILQQGMQVLQIIHNTPQGYQQTPRLVTQTHFLGNQQIQIATQNKPNKQPPQILPKPPLQGSNAVQQKQRTTTTITNQVPQQTQPQLVLANQTNTPTMINTAQGLLLNQVLPSAGPMIVQQQSGGVQLILRAPANAQQQTHTAQLTQQQLVRVVTAQGMQLQGLTPTFFALPNGFSSAAAPVIRQTPSSPAPPTSVSNGPIVIQNAMVQNQPTQITQAPTVNTSGNVQNAQPLIDQNLLPPPKKKAKKKKKPKKKYDEPPKFDLASLIKISGIDDDDIFDNDLTMETETIPAPPVTQSQPQPQTQPQTQPQAQPQPQIQMETNSIQNTTFVTMPNTSTQQNVTQLPVSNVTNVVQTNTSQENFNSNQLMTQIQNPISGQLRLEISDNGRMILHHTPEPNQPEIDQATAQALIRSLTQGGGQNSQIISQLLQAQQMIQSQNAVNNRQKLDKSPVTKLVGPSLTSPSGVQNVNPIVSPQQVQINSTPINSQNFNISGTSSNSQTIVTTPVQSQIVQPTINVSSQNVNRSAKKIVVTRKVFDSKKQAVVDVKTKVCQKTVQNSTPVGQNQIITINQHQVSNIQQTKCNQVKGRSTCINTNQQQNIQKQITVQMQKPVQTCAMVQQNIQVVKNNQNKFQQINIQDDNQFFQNIAQQISGSQSIQQQVFEQNLQQKIATSMQRTDGVKIESLNVVQNTTGNLQQPQQTVNLMQQNIGGGMQSVEQNVQFSNNLQQPQQQNILTSANNMKQQNMKTVNVNSMNNQSVEMQNLQPNILISNSQCTQQEPPKLEAQNSLLNSLPEMTPEILNALSNLKNPNDQLLIATANGQMQLISQQYLQQFLSGQLNNQAQAQQTQAHQAQAQNQAQVQHQSQTQKIVIGDPDSNNPNLQEVQINTPTSQIIVNSSGGAPTIQNNIQNIVVQAAPTQLPQQIQIQNSGFPSQFIDNLNQQQIRNLGNNQTHVNQNTNQSVNQSCAPKKTKIVKRTKVLSVSPQQTVVSKPVCVTRPVMIATTSSTTTTTSNSVTSSHQKSEAMVKPLNFFGEVMDSGKSDLTSQANGPMLPATAPNTLGTVPSPKLVHRVLLSPQNSQLLTSIQNQVNAIRSRKTDSQPLSSEDQAILVKLQAEHQRIMSTAKIVSITAQPVISEPEPHVNVNIISSGSLTSSSVGPTTCKSQLTSAQSPAATPISTTVVNSSNILLHGSSPSGIYLTNNNTPTSLQSVIPSKQQHQPQSQPQLQPLQQLAQSQIPESVSQLMVPSCSSGLESFDNSQIAASPSTPMDIPQSVIQCQTDSVDVKSNSSFIHAQSFRDKQELVSPLHSNISPASPRTVVSASGTKLVINQTKLLSPEKNDPSTSPKQGIKRSSTSSPVRKVIRSELFEQQLKSDQNGATNPDTNTPFQSKSDACKRLLRYHCYDEQVLSSKDLEKADEIFEETAKHLLSKFNSMVNKYTYLLIMDSMRETRTSELMMIDRMIVNEEQVTLSRLREQEAKAAVEEIKVKPRIEPEMEPELEPKIELESEDKFLIPKFEADMADAADFVTDGVKLEVDMDVKPGDYDEWLEIQKELGAYAPEFTLGGKCRSKSGRTRMNGESGGRDVVCTELERDLLDDAGSLDDLALYAQAQCPVSSRGQFGDRSGGPEENDITAQVQSAIDSILSLKKRPSTSGGAGGSSNQTNDANEKLLDQAVRSIMGS